MTTYPTLDLSNPPTAGLKAGNLALYAGRGLGKTTMMEKMWMNSIFGKLGPNGDSEPMLYRDAFKEQLKRKKRDPNSEHKIVKLNKSQFKVVTKYKYPEIRFLDQESPNNTFFVDYQSDLIRDKSSDSPERMEEFLNVFKELAARKDVKGTNWFKPFNAAGITMASDEESSD